MSRASDRPVLGAFLPPAKGGGCPCPWMAEAHPQPGRRAWETATRRAGAALARQAGLRAAGSALTPGSPEPAPHGRRPMQFVSLWVPGSCLRRLGLCCRKYLYVTPVAPRKGTVTLLQPGEGSESRHEKVLSGE